MSKYPIVQTKLEKIVGGGQALGLYEDGRKMFVWGGLPGEQVRVQITKKRSKLVEGRVIEVLEPSQERAEPRDKDSYLSTSPWQIMKPEAESHYKAALIEEAFELHDIVLPDKIEVYTDNHRYEYRNKVEFSWYWDKDIGQLELAFFVRDSKGKIPVSGTSLANPAINKLALAIRNILRTKDLEARPLKTLLIRCDQQGNCIWQLYVTDGSVKISSKEAAELPAAGGEVIFSEPRSPAGVITKRLQQFGAQNLTDKVQNVDFSYATEGFFQVNLPVYETALSDMRKWIDTTKNVVDMYSGVGTIGLTIGGNSPTLVELNEYAVHEMKQNISRLKLEAVAVHASSEAALEYITNDSCIILDPPRAGLHKDVIGRLLQATPERVVYLSCNPVTQARDVALLSEKYGVHWHRGYNFFPCTPHIEHLVILSLKT